MIEVLNIQATNKKDGRIINCKEIRMIPTLQDKLNITEIHDGLKYSIIERRLARINKDRVKKIKFIHEFKGIYVYNVNDKAYILFTRYKDKGELVWLLNHIIGIKEWNY